MFRPLTSQGIKEICFSKMDIARSLFPLLQAFLNFNFYEIKEKLTNENDRKYVNYSLILNDNLISLNFNDLN